jgi:predicted protein tyrosine phosphatase
MKIEIESRESITLRAKKPFPSNTALISVTDLMYDFAYLKNKPAYLLQLKFDDVCRVDFDRAVQNEQAIEIASFIKSAISNAKILICQCDYGVSRSAGIAAAVRQFLYEDGIEVFAARKYSPNKLVYRKVLEALKMK